MSTDPITPNSPADRFWARMLTASTASCVFGVGVYAYLLQETTGHVRSRILWIASVLFVLVLGLGVALTVRPTRTAAARRTTFFVLGMMVAPALLYGIHLDGGLNSPLTLVLIPPTALAAAAFPPRDAGWHLGPIVLGYLILLVAGPVPKFWVIAMGGALFLSITVPVMLVRHAALQYASAQERRADTLAVESTVDGLTQCLNHRTFHDVLQQETDAAAEGGPGFALMMIDVDHFKDINDTYGHVTGDRVLADIGQLLRRSVRPIDAVGRIGGEEFAVLLRRTDLAHATQLAEQLRTEVAAARPADIVVTISAGVSEYWAEATVPQLRRHADRLLYNAKAGGRDSVVAGPPPAH